MYKYETHCHTFPVSKCAKATVKDTVSFYKKMGYDGIFITNHFLDGNINPLVKQLNYSEQIDYYFSDYEEGAVIGEQLGIKVFSGVELSYKGTDFLIYGLNKEWYKNHPNILKMKKTEELTYMMAEGAFVVQAHPYREDYYIDHIRLFPRSVQGIEILNSSMAAEVNEMAQIYALKYHLLETAGSDNHWGSNVFKKLCEKGLQPMIAGMASEKEILSVQDFIDSVIKAKMAIFMMDENRRIFEK